MWNFAEMFYWSDRHNGVQKIFIQISYYIEEVSVEVFLSANNLIESFTRQSFLFKKWVLLYAVYNGSVLIVYIWHKTYCYS